MIKIQVLLTKKIKQYLYYVLTHRFYGYILFHYLLYNIIII